MVDCLTRWVGPLRRFSSCFISYETFTLLSGTLMAAWITAITTAWWEFLVKKVNREHTFKNLITDASFLTVLIHWYKWFTENNNVYMLKYATTKRDCWDKAFVTTLDGQLCKMVAEVVLTLALLNQNVPHFPSIFLFCADVNTITRIRCGPKHTNWDPLQEVAPERFVYPENAIKPQSNPSSLPIAWDATTPETCTNCST